MNSSGPGSRMSAPPLPSSCDLILHAARPQRNLVCSGEGNLGGDRRFCNTTALLVRIMPAYQILFLDASDNVLAVRIVHCPDDETALAHAESYGQDVEVWREHFLGRVNARTPGGMASVQS